MNGLLKKLNDALRPKVQNEAHKATLRHDNEAQILDFALRLLEKSETAQSLISYAQDSGLQMGVLRGDVDNFGFFPENSMAYISCPATQNMPPARAVIYLASGIREAMLEETAGLKRPTARVGKERFIAIQMERDRDIATHLTKIVYEINKNTGLLEIIDEFKRIGYGSLIEAYKLDMANKS